jgi:putative tricarboxylic transport membrane protein
VFVNRPISGTLMALIAVFTAWQVVAFVIKAQKKNAGTGIVHGALAEE